MTGELPHQSTPDSPAWGYTVSKGKPCDATAAPGLPCTAARTHHDPRRQVQQHLGGAARGALQLLPGGAQAGDSSHAVYHRHVLLQAAPIQPVQVLCLWGAQRAFPSTRADTQTLFISTWRLRHHLHPLGPSHSARTRVCSHQQGALPDTTQLTDTAVCITATGARQGDQSGKHSCRRQSSGRQSPRCE